MGSRTALFFGIALSALGCGSAPTGEDASALGVGAESTTVVADNGAKQSMVRLSSRDEAGVGRVTGT